MFDEHKLVNIFTLLRYTPVSGNNLSLSNLCTNIVRYGVSRFPADRRECILSAI